MGSKRILVADDEPEMVDLLALCLSRAGHEVHGVGNAEALIESVVTWRPDIVITDVEMPNGGAPRVLQYMQEAHVATPVLLMTGGQKFWAHKAVMQGRAAGVLEKPFSMRAMLDLIAALDRVGDQSSLPAVNAKTGKRANPIP